MAFHSYRRLLPLVAAALLGSACGRDRQAAPADAPRQGGTAVVAIPTDMDVPNSLVTGDKWMQEVNRFLLFLPLIDYGPKLEYRPVLAASYDLQGDTAAVFHLRRDIRWTDGQPVTAQDVVFTYQRAADPKTAFPNSEYFAYWTGGEVLDPYTVRFHFKPHADPLAGLPFLPIMPKHLLDSIAPERLRDAAFNQHPVGDGPFRLVERRANERWIFEANPDFPPALGGRPRLDRLVIRIVPEAEAQLAGLISGELDVATTPGAKAFRDVANRPQIRRVPRPTRQVLFIVWNGKRPALRDARLRHALALGVDRRTILDALRGGFGQVATGPIPPSHWAFDASLRPLPYAPDSARAALARLGYRDRNGDGLVEDPSGKPFRIALKVPASSSFNRNVAEMVQAQLARIGVKVDVVPTDGRVFLDDVTSPERRFDAAIMAFESDFRIVYRDQFHSASIGKPFQLASYSNAAVDSIIDRAPLTMDRAKALPLWHRFQAILLDEEPWTFLYYFPDLVLVRRELRDADMDVRGTFVNVTRWWKAPATMAGAAQN